jgi:quercetin dioxygenase-like cupin family protein
MSSERSEDGFAHRRSRREAAMPVTNTGELARGNMEGAAYGASVSLIFDHSEPGSGPRLHRHPYDETWVVIEGNLTFQLVAFLYA